MTFYTKVLAKLVNTGDLDITVNLTVNNPEGISEHTSDEVKGGLRDLDLNDIFMTE